MKLKRGFSLVEISLGLAILSIITLTILRLISTIKQDTAQAQERYQVLTLQKAIKNSFLEVVSMVENSCYPENDGYSPLSWGYRHPRCQNTSPLPYMPSQGVLRYDVNLSNDPRLLNRIVSNYSGVCVLQRTDNQTFVELFCPNLLSLTYDTNARFHSPNNPFPTNTAPTVIVNVRREGFSNPIRYTFSLDDLFQERRNYSLKKFQDLMERLRTESQYLSHEEFNNPPPRGLPSGDDVLVSYFWKVFSDDYNRAKNTLCDTAGGNVCVNYDAVVWRRGILSQTVAIRRAVQNLMNGEVKYFTDGFGNAVSLIPFVSQCGNDLSTCQAFSPPVPQKFYSPNPTPPFVSVLYNEFGRDKNASTNLWNRYYVTH